MKPHSVYFTIDLTQRPPNESKRGVVYRAFATAAKDAVEAAMAESSLPDAVLIMVTLAPKPVLPEKQEEAAP